LPLIAVAKERVGFGASALSSVHYTYGAAATKAINESSDMLEVTVLATGGAVDNLNRLQRKQIQIGTGTYATFYQAYHGIGAYEGKANKELRGLWVHAPSTQAWIVRQDSGVSKIEQLESKTFTPGQRGSATEQLVMQMLDVLKIKPNYFRASLSDAVDAVKDGRSIGYTKAGGTGSLDGTTLELKATTDINILSFTPEQVKQVKTELPFINFMTYPEGQFEGFGEVTTPVQVIGQITTRDALSKEQVKEVLTGIFDNREPQIAAFPSFGKFNPLNDSVELITIPLHAGAVEFYRERGLTVPERLVPPEMK
jgi:hypothetical protein